MRVRRGPLTVARTTSPYSPNGQYLYVSRAITPAGDVTEFAIDPDGNLTLTGPTGGTQAGDTPEGIAIAPNGQFLYVVNSGDDDVQMFSISPTDGTLTPGPNLWYQRQGFRDANGSDGDHARR